MSCRGPSRLGNLGPAEKLEPTESFEPDNRHVLETLESLEPIESLDELGASWTESLDDLEGWTI